GASRHPPRGRGRARAQRSDGRGPRVRRAPTPGSPGGKPSQARGSHRRTCRRPCTAIATADLGAAAFAPLLVEPCAPGGARVGETVVGPPTGLGAVRQRAPRRQGRSRGVAVGDARSPVPAWRRATVASGRLVSVR